MTSSWGLSCRDVDGDGFADVLIGAMGYDVGQTDEGLAAVYSGSGLVTGATPLWFGRGYQAGARFGCSVAGGGDVNQDGLSDLTSAHPA